MVSVVESDSVRYLTERAEPVEHGLAEAEAAVALLGARGLIAFDDTVYRAREFHGEGRLAVPWLLAQGWRVLWSGYQTTLGSV